jgi:hypothetical protein
MVLEVFASGYNTDHLFQQMDATLRDDSNLETVKKGVTYRQRQSVEEKAIIIQSNMSPRRISSAIWRLPTEILSEIFLYCLPQDQHLLPKPELAPLVLTTICRRWKEVAVGFPMLWCTLQLEVDRDNWQQKALCYDSWLKRSRGCPLSLRIVCKGDLSELRNLLQPYIPQISSLVLVLSNYDSPFMMDDFHALKELTIRSFGLDLKQAIEHTVSKLPVNLRRLDTTDALFNHRQFVTGSSYSSWVHLTHLKIQIQKLDGFPRLLRLCPNLSSLSMVGIMHAIQTPESVTHTNLQDLRMCENLFGECDVDLGLFNAITLPNLRLIDVRQMGPWPHEEFKAFLMRSKCPLESLIFGLMKGFTDQQRAEYTSLLPSLKIVEAKGFSQLCTTIFGPQLQITM